MLTPNIFAELLEEYEANLKSDGVARSQQIYGFKAFCKAIGTKFNGRITQAAEFAAGRFGEDLARTQGQTRIFKTDIGVIPFGFDGLNTQDRAQWAEVCGTACVNAFRDCADPVQAAFDISFGGNLLMYSATREGVQAAVDAIIGYLREACQSAHLIPATPDVAYNEAMTRLVDLCKHPELLEA